MSRVLWRRSALVLLVALAAGCGDGPNESLVCIPGEQIGCIADRNGTLGAQSCLPDGSGFAACEGDPAQAEPGAAAKPAAVPAPPSPAETPTEPPALEPAPPPPVPVPTPPPAPKPTPERTPAPPTPPAPPPDPSCLCREVTTQTVDCTGPQVTCRNTSARGEAPCGSLTQFEQQVAWDNETRQTELGYPALTSGVPFAAPASLCTGSDAPLEQRDVLPVPERYDLSPGCFCTVFPFAITCARTLVTSYVCGGAP